MRLIKTTLLIGSLVFFAAMSGICIAEIESGSVFISPFVGGFNFEGNRDYEDGPTYGLGVGYNFDEHWGAEAVFNFVESEFERKGGDLNAYIYRLDGLYHFMPSQKIVPYMPDLYTVSHTTGHGQFLSTACYVHMKHGITLFIRKKRSGSRYLIDIFKNMLHWRNRFRSSLFRPDNKFTSCISPSNCY